MCPSGVLLAAQGTLSARLLLVALSPSQRMYGHCTAGQGAYGNRGATAQTEFTTGEKN